jgi:hypothetical protein
MIPKHTQFIEAIKEKKKISVRYYSHADSGVLDRICAPMNYGPGDLHDGLNRYWFWDYASNTGVHALGLMPKQIEDLQVLGELFDPAEFTSNPFVVPAPAPGSLPAATPVSPVVRQLIKL